ncbi:MAG: hypothetical protein ACOZNI_33285 [Myxococcota bacterium]
MGQIRKLGITAVSEIAWRLPGWPVRFLQSFSESERGSAVDMLAAAELTDRGDLRRKYFLHALDETKHAGLFRARAAALGGADDRTRAALDDAGTLQRHGIVNGRTMFERFGETEFLAFVYVAEADAVEQFNVYRERRLPEQGTIDMLGEILKDEAFHVSYSKNELEKLRKAGQGKEVDDALSRVRWRRVKEAWLRFSRDVGTVVSGVWLALLYVFAVGPFRFLARLEPGGWQPVLADPRDRMRAARSQG